MSTSHHTRDSQDPSSSSYLYHKQRPARRSRQSQESERKKEDSATAARDTFMVNVRIFMVVAVCMSLLLALALFVNKRSWQNKLSASRSGPAPQAESGRTGPHRLEAALSSTSVDSRNALDTDAIRQALAIAKEGRAAQDEGRTDDAIRQYRKALDMWPHLTDVWASLGRLYLAEHKYGLAQASLERAVENSPDTVDVLNDLGVSYLYQRNTQQALTLFQTALDLDPTYASSYFNLALCHLAAKDSFHAQKAIDAYLRLKPDDPKALRELAFLQAVEGSYDLALETLRRAIEELPEWPLLYFDAAASAALSGKEDMSVNLLKQAEQYAPPSLVLRVYEEPAFETLRRTEKGKAYAAALGARADANPTAETREDRSEVEPLTSMAPE